MISNLKIIIYDYMKVMNFNSNLELIYFDFNVN